MITQTHKALIVALFFALFPISAYGATFLPVSDDVASLRTEAIGDVYALNKSIVIHAPVQGDIFAAGEGVDVSGSSSASVFAIGRNISISGDVQDDVRVAGDILSIGSNIAHDLFVAGSQILITKDSHVHGDTYIAGENVTISGTVHGTIRAATNKLTLTNGSVVMGDIKVYGSAPIIEGGATVSGKITTVAPAQKQKEVKRGLAFGALVASIVSATVFALALLYGAPVLVAKSKEIITAHPVQSAVTGLLWLFLFIPVALILFATNIGVYIGFFVLFATLPLVLLGFGIMVIATGSLVNRLIFKNDGTPWQHAIIGAVIIAIVALLKSIGAVLIAVAFLIALGAVLKAFWAILQGK
ncbi:MAG: polymer-forming cytoskeletal protein [Patescibacteria group bacterium]